MEEPSHAHRDMELERLRKRVALLQRNAERDKELLCCKDEELHRQKGPSPAPSCSQGGERRRGEENRKRNKRSFHHEDREKTPPRDRTISPPHKNRRDKHGRRKLKDQVPHS